MHSERAQPSSELNDFMPLKKAANYNLCETRTENEHTSPR